MQMDIPLQPTTASPIKPVLQAQIGEVNRPKDQTAQVNAQPETTIPSELCDVAAVNESRIAGQKPSIPEIMATERVLKPYDVTMLPNNETGEKVTQHKA